MAMDRFAAIELFVAVAEAGSLTRAADACGLSISAASRYLFALEEHLGVRLVQRTTRRLYLTDAGNEFYRRSKSLMTELREAEDAVTESSAKPTGLLRVTASLSFCLLHVEPLLPAFMAKYPELSVEIIASNRYYDIIDNNIDLAIRTRQFEADSSITIRRLAATRRLLAASPAYLAQHGTPRIPADLAAHKMLVYSHAVEPYRLRFTRGEEVRDISIKPVLEASDGQVVVRAALHGMGILAQPRYIIDDDIRHGRLVPLLNDWDLPRLTMNFAFPSRQHLPAKVRLFMDAMIEDFEQHGYEQLWTS